MPPMRLLNLMPRVSSTMASPLRRNVVAIPSGIRWHNSCSSSQVNAPLNDHMSHDSTITKNFHSKSAYKQILEDTDHPDIAKLLVDNKKWVEDSKNSDPKFFEKIGGKQTPKYLYIGCSDSRVPANEILGLGPGEVFVHRNVGNLVLGNDLSVLSVIEFAVKVLGVKHIIVTGHYDCGAVRASCQNQDLGLLENWIRNIRDTHRIHRDVVDALPTDEDKHKCLVELSAIEQCYTVFKMAAVQKKRKETAEESGGKNVYPQVTAMVFDPTDCLLKKLPVDFEKSMAGYKHVYDLY